MILTSEKKRIKISNLGNASLYQMKKKLKMNGDRTNKFEKRQTAEKNQRLLFLIFSVQTLFTFALKFRQKREGISRT